MIRKITEIKNIGKFKRYKSSEISFPKFCGIFSGNGQGKSTLTTVMRSLNDNNPLLILGRKTINEPGKPLFVTETDGGFVTFNGDTWDSNPLKFEIFDAHFVNQNIYSGMQVDIQQRRRLYQFIIGRSAIELNEAVNTTNDKITKLTSEIRENKSKITTLIGPDSNFEEFIELEEIDKIDVKIESKAKEINALKNKDKLAKRVGFGRLVRPTLDFAVVRSLLLKTIDGLASDSEERVRLHIKSHLDKHGEDWIKAGVEYLQKQNNKCPFCESSVTENKLISSYRDFFNQAYLDFKTELNKLQEDVKRQFSDVYKVTFKKVISDNIVELDYWSEYLDTLTLDYMDEAQGDVFPILLQKNVDDFYESFQAILFNYISAKNSSPLDSHFTGDDLDTVEKVLNGFSENVSHYNRVIDSNNSLIESYKKGLGESDIPTEEKSLKRLRLAKLRYEETTRKLAEKHLELESNKKSLEDEKNQAKEKLEQETQRIPALYQDKINEFLEHFGAEFKIVDHKKVNPRGEAATEYKLLLNGSEIPLGDSETPDDVPSFKNTLSEGDKSTLAFSYFLAKLSVESNLADKILIFDDPISSQDASRRLWTKNYLAHFGERSKQLIVLSHDNRFIEEMEKKLRKFNFSCFKIERTEVGNILSTTTVEELSKTDHLRNLEKVKNYVRANLGSPEDVQARMRHLCEDHFRRTCPHSFIPSDNLGNMIKKVRESSNTSEMAPLKGDLLQYETINESALEESHGQQGEKGLIDEPQLLSHCKLTMKLIGETAE